jgi:hypothetical protein
MRFLIVTADYPQFLHWLYLQNKGLEQRPYEEQVRVRGECPFGVASFYVSNLRKLGHEAYIIYANNEFLQRTWARERGLKVEEPSGGGGLYRQALRRWAVIAAKTPLHSLKPFSHTLRNYLVVSQPWFHQILSAQVQYYRPDVLLNLVIRTINGRLLREMEPHAELLIGQHAATRLTYQEDLKCYDFVISSFPPTINWLRKRGIRAELIRLGFEPDILSYLNEGCKTIEVSFVGSFFNVHASRVRLLEALSAQFEQIKIWAPDIEKLDAQSPIRKRYVGQVWGLDMFKVLQGSKITLNHHGDIAPHANNLRLYEATGVGTLLLTDYKEDLGEMFEPQREVVAYRNLDDCVGLIHHYLKHDEERETIARAGQARTLREHTWFHRMQELEDIMKKYL